MKTILVSIHKKWLDMIISGEKKFEFRKLNCSKWKTGDRVLLLESLGKKLGYQQYNDDGFYGEIVSYQKMFKILSHDEGYEFHNNREYAKEVYEGTGLIRAEFVIGNVELMVYGILEHNGEIVMNKKEMGYTNQPLAFEITQLIVYDTPKDKSELIVASKFTKWRYTMKDDLGDGNFSDLEYAIRKNMFPVLRSPQSFMYVLDKER
jgi:hypothetical protein